MELELLPKPESKAKTKITLTKATMADAMEALASCGWLVELTFLNYGGWRCQIRWHTHQFKDPNQRQHYRLLCADTMWCKVKPKTPYEAFVMAFREHKANLAQWSELFPLDETVKPDLSLVAIPKRKRTPRKAFRLNKDS